MMSLAIISKQENVCGKDSASLISLLFHIVVDVLVLVRSVDYQLGTPRGRYDEHNSKFSSV
jgi:hypothetical protein